MVDFVSKLRYDINDLKRLMTFLRSQHGCPWDRKQTHKSIRENLLEEANEVVEAIDSENTEELLEELGDLLLQVVFHSEIAANENKFNLDDVINATCKKLLRRHPHVFGNIRAGSEAESLVIWNNVKQIEKNVRLQGKRISDMTVSEMEELYHKTELEK